MKKISRREFTHLGSAAALGALVSSASCARDKSREQAVKKEEPLAEKDRPNVIFFMSDDQRWDGM
ncbi:MAG TPA: hypothetical protein VM123_10815, partial [archaeon]|nr:hypothetical protein [archaeon]